MTQDRNNNAMLSTAITQQPLELQHSSASNRAHVQGRRSHRRSSHHHHHRSNNNNYQIYTLNSAGSEQPQTESSPIRLLFSSSSSSTSQRHFSYKKHERNLLSASCSIFCIAILAVSLIEIRWFYLSGGGCNVNYIGAAHFFSPGRLEYQSEISKVTKTEIKVYTFVLSNGLELRNCANREIMLIMRTVIAFVFLAIFSSCCGLLLDTFGCMKPGVRLLRRNAIFHIMAVVFCLIVNGFCFWISEKINDQQIETRSKKGKKIDVSFDVSYYLIVLAGGLSILATAFTLIRRYPSDEDEQLERLLEEYTGFEEPIHLERSLPAPVQPNSTENQCSSLQPLLSLQPLPPLPPPPPPPSTPPPSLLRQNSVMSEPPPPYNSDNNSSFIA